MKYAVLQNSTQEIINWFKKLPNSIDCNLSGKWKYLVHCPDTQESYFTDYLYSSEEILLTPEEFTKKFIKKENMKTITYEQGEHHCFNNQAKKSEYTTVWNKVSLTNPLIEEPQYI